MEDKIKGTLKAIKLNENLISTAIGTVILIISIMWGINYVKDTKKTGAITEKAVEMSDNLTVEGEEIGDKDIYVVKKGDRLWKIAEETYGSGEKYKEIAELNKISNPRKIEIGDRLVLPKLDKTEKPETVTKVETKTEKVDKGTYSVQKGDCLWKVAVASYGDGFAWTKIYQANKAKIGKNPNRIAVGVVLTLP